MDSYENFLREISRVELNPFFFSNTNVLQRQKKFRKSKKNDNVPSKNPSLLLIESATPEFREISELLTWDHSFGTYAKLPGIFDPPPVRTAYASD